MRVTIDPSNRAMVKFIGFPGGAFSTLIDTNADATLQSPGWLPIKIYGGGRDDAFFNDLQGFFRSINYAPQFYHVNHARPREVDQSSLVVLPSPPMRASAMSRQEVI